MGNLEVIEFSDGNRAECFLGRDEEGNLKVFRFNYKRDNPLAEWNVHTGIKSPKNHQFGLDKSIESLSDYRLLADGDGNIAIAHEKGFAYLNLISSGAKLGVVDIKKPIKSVVLAKWGRCVATDNDGGIHIFDLVKQLKQKIQTHNTLSCYVAVDTRSLGNPYFVSAASDGTVRLWTNEKEKKEQETNARKAIEVFEKFKGAHSDARGIIHDYVGPDAHQALAEIQREKVKKEEKKVSRLVQMSKDAGLD